MTAPVSPRWIAAEAVAWPFRSQLAFERALTHLIAAERFRPSDTARLGDELDEWIRPRARGLSLDALRRAREGMWFGGRLDVPLPLYDLLAAAARRHLDCRGSSVVLRGSGDAVRDVAASWRYLSLALPADLLLGVASVEHGLAPPDQTVELATPLIGRVLEREPACETHMHVGAAFSFPLLWTAVMAGMIDRDRDFGDADGGVPFGSPEAFRQRLAQAAIVRLLLASYFRRRDRFDAALSFSDFKDSNRHDDPRTLASLAAAIDWKPGAGDALRLLRRVLGSLAQPAHAMPSAADMVHIYRCLVGPDALRGMQRIGDRTADGSSLGRALAYDPLAIGSETAEGVPLPEMALACRVLDALRTDAELATVFWQYQRIRCRTFRFITEEPGTAGLDWFTRHYTRLRLVRGILDQALYHSALTLQSGGLRLGALEARTSPQPRYQEVRDEIRKCARQADHFLCQERPGREQPAEVGLVLHFIKQGIINNRDSGDPVPSTWRYGAWYRDVQPRVAAIETVLEKWPQTLAVFRGVDIANHELAIPTWVIIPLMRRVRDASIIAASRMRRLKPRWNCVPLRVTWHGGEDFRRLVEGIRRMHEPMEFELLQPGDRIGHGIALGADPQRVLRDWPTVMQPREERLFDLLWELKRYRSGDIGPDATRVEIAREQAARLGAEIFDDEVSVDALIAMRDRLHCPAILDRYGYGEPRPRDLVVFNGLRAETLLQYYLRDPAVYQRAIAPIDVAMNESEATMLINAQRFLARTMGQAEITIESNPSSNQLIGDMSDLVDHPSFRIQPLPGCEPALGNTVPLSINTDNPITFATRLADEYAYVYYALLRAGVTADRALAWVDARREDGWRSRFTLRATTDRSVLREVYEPEFERQRQRTAAPA